jgi:hypothetical protein
MPDAAGSSGVPIIVTPRERVTRVPGVVDLMSSSGGEEEAGRPETSEDEDEETVLGSGLLPRTEEFDYVEHRGSDGGRNDDESNFNDDDDEESDDRSAALF